MAKNSRARYQAEVMLVLLSRNRNPQDGVEAQIDVTSAAANLNELELAADRLQKRTNGLMSTEEIILLTKDAEKRARESVRQIQRSESAQSSSA